jgi:hypothetical protein
LTRSTPHRFTWQVVSRAAGLTIVFALLLAFLVEDALGHRINTTVTLAFLTIATGLIGLPSGYTIVKRNESSNGSH